MHSSGDSRRPPRARPGSVRPVHAGLSRIQGVLPAIAAGAGLGTARITGAGSLAEACARIAAGSSTRVGPRAPIPLVPVRRGRLVVGAALAPEACLSALAEAVLAGRSCPVTMRGPCPPPVARRLGLRFPVRRRLASDPALNALLEETAEASIRAFSAWCVPAGPGDGWHAALVVPRIEHQRGRCVSALVVTCPDPLSIRVVELPHDAGLAPGLPPADLAPAVAAALAGPGDSPDTHYVLLPESGAYAIVHHLFPDDCEARCTTAFSYFLRWHLTRSRRAALSAFRHLLPAPLAAVAGRTRSGFGTPQECAMLLESRAGWTTHDHARLLQAIERVPWLVRHVEAKGVAEAARRGAPLEEIVRVVTGRDKPLRPKVLRALARGWGGPPRHAGGTGAGLSITCDGLDALYRLQPHHPVLCARSLRAAATALCGPGQALASDADRALLLLALRDDDGAIGDPPPDLADMIRWLTRTCTRLLAAPDAPAPATATGAAGALAAAIACPPHRRRRGLAAMVADWHERIGPMTSAHAALARDLQEGGTRAETSAPHFLDGPVGRLGVEIRPLATAGALRAEGEDLGHCIGTYDWALEAGRCLLVGLSNPDGRSSAEIVVTREDRGRSLGLVQHRGVRNAPPPANHVEALAAAMSDVSPERLDALAEDLARHARSCALLAQAGVSRLGAEARTALADLAMEHLRPFLSGPDAGLPRPLWLAASLGRIKAEAGPLVAVA